MNDDDAAPAKDGPGAIDSSGGEAGVERLPQGHGEAVAPEEPASPPEPRQKARRESRGFLEAAVLVLVALVLALTLKTYVAEAYEIKGRSMEPTFLSGQRVVVLKAFYEIHREDVVVFSSTEDPSKDLIKRVVGLPGETLKIVGGRVYINGQKLQEDYARFGERGVYERPVEERIAPGHYFVLGDNRPDSHDSRYFDSVPATSIRGKVVARWWPFKDFKSFWNSH